MELLKKLISFDTSKNESELAIFLESYIKKLNLWFDIERQYIDDENRFNLIIKNTDKPDILLWAHMDVVPVSNVNQFQAVIKDNKLYGRWAVDMKWWMYAILKNLEKIKNKKVWILFYCDEEYNFKWMRKFIEKLDNINPELIIIPEPTNNKIIANFKWICEFNLEIFGETAHAAMWRWKNSIKILYNYVQDLEKFFNKNTLFKSTVNIAWINGGLLSNKNIIWSGNQLADYVKALLEIRIWNNTSEQEFIDFTNNWFEKADCKINLNINFYLKPLIQKWIKQKYNDFDYSDGSGFGYSDIALLNEKFPEADCILFGPGPMEKAHKEDEYLDLESFENFEKDFIKLLEI